jgi:LysM repeat protein
MSYLHPNDELIIPVEGATPSPTVPPSEVVHVVQEGERLSDIVDRYGVSEERIRRANELESGTRIQPGDRLIVPLNRTPGPTATPTSTFTPTPGPPYPAPHLLYPLQNATFRGADGAVTLQWASVGILEEDEWYAVDLRYLGRRPHGQSSQVTVYTRITSWRVPEEWYPGRDASEHRFEWTVYVVRQAEATEPTVLISPEGYVRRFEWR